MREYVRIGMYVLIVLNIVTSVSKIKQGNYWEVMDNLVIIMLSISIIGYMAENEKLEKEKVTILRINNRSDDEC
ncbi:hypothetical protein [Mammaliicoccus sciuri]|uniref:hypothetical protein n=1 Tax=Mammaliicoccus sciuri TaxID=1296 RepID=UPI00195E13DE|nr:hypothetical protein [Mammaliicoccus sciuri]